MKKIGLYLGIDPGAGGMFQYAQSVLDAVSALPSGEYASVVVYTSPRWSKYLDRYGMRSRHIPYGSGRGLFWKAWKAMRLPVSVARRIGSHLDPMAITLLREHCDLWIFPSQDTLAFQVPVPALSTIHDLMHRYEPRFREVSERGTAWKRDWNYRNTCRWADGILVDSSVGKDHVMESYGRSGERIHVLPYVAPRYIHAQEASADLEKKYNLPKKYIFYPAQFWEHKNHRNLIEAVGRLMPEIPDLKLVLVGSEDNGYGPTVEFIQGRNLTDAVRILGYVADEDMPQLYRRARALVMPTFFGPTNIPPLEAFAVGCPVAVSGIYGIPEQVGDAALLFDPADVGEIAQCIRRLWADDDLCETLVSRGRQRAAAWGQRQFNERFRNIIEDTLHIRSSRGLTLRETCSVSLAAKM